MANNFTLNNGVIVPDAYARARIIARLRRFGFIPLEERRAVADYLVSPQSGKQGYLVSALERDAFDIWANDAYKGE